MGNRTDFAHAIGRVDPHERRHAAYFAISPVAIDHRHIVALVAVQPIQKRFCCIVTGIGKPTYQPVDSVCPTQRVPQGFAMPVPSIALQHHVLPRQFLRLRPRTCGPARKVVRHACSVDKGVVRQPIAGQTRAARGNSPCCNSFMHLIASERKTPSLFWRAHRHWRHRAATSSISALASPILQHRHTSSRLPSRRCATAITAIRQPTAYRRSGRLWLPA